jgi:hypothetical protein
MTEGIFIDDPALGKLRIDDLTRDDIDDFIAQASEWCREAERRATAASSLAALNSNPIAQACAEMAHVMSRVASLALDVVKAVDSGKRDRVMKLGGLLLSEIQSAVGLLDEVGPPNKQQAKDKHLRKAQEKAVRVMMACWADAMLAEKRWSFAPQKITQRIPAMDCVFSVKDANLWAGACLEAIQAIANPEAKAYERGLLKAV